MQKKLVIASANKGKINEFQQLLPNFELVAQSQLGISNAIEDGLSFVENAIIKARHASQHSGLAAIADDSGIEVDALNGAPGIYSARFAGANASDQDNIKELLSQMRNIAVDKRQARFRCVIVLMTHATDPSPRIFEGSWEGMISQQIDGQGGFGYDPIFYLPELSTTAAQLAPEAKNAISHRGQALSRFVDYWQSRNSQT